MASFQQQQQLYRTPKFYNRKYEILNDGNNVINKDSNDDNNNVKDSSILDNENIQEYYKLIIINQLSKNQKIINFEEQQKKWQQDIIQKLQLKSEIQKDTVLKLEEEFRKDMLWKEYIKALMNLSKCTSCIALQSYILNICNIKINDLLMDERKITLENFIDILVNRKLIVGINDLKYILKSMKESGVVISSSLNKLQIIINDCDNLYKEILNIIACYQQNIHDSDNPSNCYQLIDNIQQVLQQQLLVNIELDHHQKVDLLKEYIVELNIQVEDINKKKQLEVNTDSFNNQLVGMFPYFSHELKSSKWFANLKQSNINIHLSQNLDEQLRIILNKLKYQSLLQLTALKDTQQQQEISNNNSIPLYVVDSILIEIEQLLKAVIKEGSKAFIKVFLCISESIFNEVRQVNALIDILMYATIVCGIFRSLSSDMHEQSSKIFTRMLSASCSLCTPNVLITVDINTISSELEVRVAMFYAALLSQSRQYSIESHTTTVSPLTIAEGWIYLHRILVQLHCLIYFHSNYNKIKLIKGSDVKNNIENDQQHLHCKRIILACKVIRNFLRIAGNNLLINYQDKFIDVLKSCQHIIIASNNNTTTTSNAVETIEADYLHTDDVRKLISFLDDSIKQAFIAPLYYRNQSPTMLDAAYLTSEKEVVRILEQDKASLMMSQVKQLGLDRLRAIFNKLSVTKESQQSAIQSLLEKIIISSTKQASTSTELLRYTLFKISSNIINDIQEEFFDAMDEGHPMKIAIVTCTLCSQIKELANLVKAQFYKYCPLTIPKVAESGLTGEEFLLDMGFQAKEDRSHWLERMSKILCTFSVILLQPQQSVWNIADGWTWLANIVNTHSIPTITSSSLSNTSTYSNNSSSSVTTKLPFYLATSLEVVLRVISLELYKHYGEKFISILIIIRDQIMPYFTSDTPHRDGLEEFLLRFINSKGKDFMILFSKRCY